VASPRVLAGPQKLGTRLVIDGVKIDRSVVQPLPGDAAGAATTSAVAGLGHLPPLADLPRSAGRSGPQAFRVC
jgi:hypothetical protein